MSKKSILIMSYVIVVIIIISFGAVSIYMCLNSEKNVPTNVDMALLDSNISSEAGFNKNRMKSVTADNITEIFNIEKEEVKEVVGKVPLLNISSGMYVVVHTEKENVEQVKQKLIQYGKNYESQWSTYMEDQYELVRKRKIGNIGNYVYMIVYETPDDLIKHIKGK